MRKAIIQIRKDDEAVVKEAARGFVRAWNTGKLVAKRSASLPHDSYPRHPVIRKEGAMEASMSKERGMSPAVSIAGMGAVG